MSGELLVFFFFLSYPLFLRFVDVCVLYLYLFHVYLMTDSEQLLACLHLYAWCETEDQLVRLHEIVPHCLDSTAESLIKLASSTRSNKCTIY